MKFLTRLASSDKSGRGQGNLDRFRRKKFSWLWLIVLLVAAVIGWYGAAIMLAIKNSTTKNYSQLPSLLEKRDGVAGEPINILLIGIGGANHPGGNLADTLIVASVDVKSKTISLLSIPRDLYVTIGEFGKDKINTAHAIGETQLKSRGGGPALSKQVVSQLLGVPISYFVRVDFSGFHKIIDTLDGVTVNVDRAIFDPRFPDAEMKGFEPFSISAGTHTLNGTTALKYVRSRETTSDFDRAKRQQQVIVAIKDKMLSANVLSNPKKTTDIITTLGKNILTDFSPSEFDQIARIAASFNRPTVNTYVLDNGDKGLVTAGRSANGASSIVIPKAGPNDFSEIRFFTRAYFSAPPRLAEAPAITVKRGTGTPEQVSRVATELGWAGFKVTVSDNPSSDVKITTLYASSDDSKPKSLNYLQQVYAPAKVTVSATNDFLLVVGANITRADPDKLRAGVVNSTPW